MSGTSSELQELQELAEDLLLETGAIRRCEFHGTLIDEWNDDAVEKACSIATEWHSDSLIGIPGGVEVSDLVDIIRGVYENSADKCHQCKPWHRIVMADDVECR